MKIVVSGNCQTAGLAAALRALTDASEVAAVPLLGEAPDALRAKLQAQLQGADAFVYSANNTVARELATEANASTPVLLSACVPLLHFAGFHPDICYAWHQGTRKLTEPHYNSALVVWAYAHGLDAAETEALFRPDIFAALGYFDAWRQSTEALRKAFASTDLADRFSDFFLHVKRRGCFMHSMNHPRVDALNHLARLTAERLGLPLRRDIGPGEINDGLNSTVWPVYPALADALGLAGGGYHWKYLGKHQFIDGLGPYIAQARAAYAAQGIAPVDLAITYQATAVIDRVLAAATGR